MDVALEIENQLIQIRSILFEISSGNVDAAKRGLDEAYKVDNVHTAMRATLDSLKAWAALVRG